MTDERVLTALGFDTVREMLAAQAVSPRGAAAARELVPRADRSEVLRLTDETKEAETIIISQPAFPLQSFDEVTAETARLRSGADLNCAELLRICRLLKAAKRAAQYIKKNEEGTVRLLPEIARELYYDDGVIDAIDRSILSEDEIADDASPELRNIRRRIRSENDSIRDRLQSIIRSREMGKYLQEAIITQRNGRYVVPVKLEYRAFVQGMIHSQSASGQTLFIEPMAVVEANNRLRILEEEEAREIERVLHMLSEFARPCAPDLTDDMEKLTYLDVVFAKASLARAQKAVPCTFRADGSISIRQGRHPLIDPAKVIPITLECPDEKNTLIITGPNTGGKTVTLKLVGLYALMAQSGLFLPATGADMPVFSDVFADIGDEQSIEQSLSTFSSHMRNIIDIVKRAGKHSLALIDELGAGTDPEEGTALALAILCSLSERGAKTLTTTHYSEIKAFAMTAPGFINAGMEFDSRSLKPTYHLLMGVAGSSNAFLISKSLGLPEEVIERAGSFMRAERLEFDALMDKAEQTRRDAEAKLAEIGEMKAKAEQMARRAEQQEKELEDKRRAAVERAHKEALEIVSHAKDEAEDIIKDIRRTRGMSESESTKIVENARRQLSTRKDMLQKTLTRPKKPHKKAKAEDIIPGASVNIASLGVEATVLSAPDAKGMVTVQAGIMKLQRPMDDLEPRDKPSAKKAMRTSSVSRVRKSVPLSINLHGYTVDEALLEVDQYLDDAFLAGLNEVSIVHGKGTGTLRSGVQAFLRRHPHVEKFRAGKFGEGETGVTIVTLK